MNVQHLSDEAIAAFADGVLIGHARERATRHTASCPECRYAVAVQREAVWALRAAPAPALPTGLLQRLREVPSTTPLAVTPTVIASDGSTMFPTFGSTVAPMAALVAPARSAPPAARNHRRRAVFATAMSVAAAGVLAVGSVAQASGEQRTPAQPRPGWVVPAARHGAPIVIEPATLHRVLGH
ncbi:MAG: hypothetical protein ACR2LF_07215 [Jatrophihabitantaceae bacterium]